jgi:hypothetical protein
MKASAIKKAGTGFSYTRADGSKLTEQDVLRQIKALAVIYRRGDLPPKEMTCPAFLNSSR